LLATAIAERSLTVLRPCRSSFRVRLNCCLALFVCVAIITSVIALPTASARGLAIQGPIQNPNGKARKVKPAPPEKEPPKMVLPNLDEIRKRPSLAPQIVPPSPSTIRSQNKQPARANQSSAENLSSPNNSLKFLASSKRRLGKGNKNRNGSLAPSSFHHAPAKPLPQEPSATERAIARLDRFNQTGDQLAARDCEWSLPLLNLPGRAGLDLSLTLSYSSLVWTRAGNKLYFDEDRSNISPGFSLGFPRIEDVFFDTRANVNARLLVTSAGRRVELLQLGSSNVYEATDSSYLQLTDNGDTLTLRSTEGTQITYEHQLSSTGWQARKIKDRNGNYISITNKTNGDIQSITDTLGRNIIFHYDDNDNLDYIGQSWNGTQHQWATLGWDQPQALTLNTAQFTDAAVVAPGGTIPVLTQVGLPDGSRYTFEYSAVGQVQMIRRYSADAVERSHTAYDYDNAANDCPRITQMRNWAENWSGVWDLPAEALTSFSLPGDGSHQMIAPDSTVYKDFYGSGWQQGLLTRAEVWTGATRARLSLNAYTQDNPAASFPRNPRVYESNIYDGSGNHRRTTIEYTAFGKPLLLTEYDGATPLRNTLFEYVTDASYVSKRMVGLLYRQTVFDGSWTPYARTTYGYDGEAVQSQAQTATQHESAYNPSFAARGNVTSISRWDVFDIDNAAKALTTHLSYDSAGNLLTNTDAAGHTSSIGYTDSFDDYSSRNTFAYATTVTDSDGFSTYLQYRYDFGAQTRVQGPPPGNQSQGLIQSISYDEALRPLQITTVNTGGYVRYGYGPNYRWSLASINNPTDEAYKIDIFNGLGLLTQTVRNHPGSAGGYSAQPRYYDIMGRPMIEYNPRELDANWQPSGTDDTGWYFSRQSYDWKNRPLVTTNQDGTQKYASYAGCGCAGGEGS
jgi:YD repeat-containing protein